MFTKFRAALLGYLFALALFLLLTSCGVTGEGEFTETFTFDVQGQSEIVSDTTGRQVAPDSIITVYNFSIEPGSSLVFEYGRNVHPPKNVTDAGLLETLVFQIPTGSDTFELTGNQLSEAQSFYRRGCFCPESGAGFMVSDGFLEGEKLSANIWFVRADVVITGFRQNYEITFEHIFRLKQ